MRKAGGKSKIMALITIVALMLGVIPQAALGTPSDISGHWAQNQITEWMNKGLASGYTDGTFKPDNSITRAEFMVLVNKAFGFTETSQARYKDVQTSDWFAADIARAKGAGYISGYPDGTIRPNNSISRQEAASMLARLLKLDTADTSSISKFKDAAQIPRWSMGAISAVVSAGYMQGYPDMTFQPEKNITRAEAIVSLNRALGGSTGQDTPQNTVTDDKAVKTEQGTTVTGGGGGGSGNSGSSLPAGYSVSGNTATVANLEGVQYALNQSGITVINGNGSNITGNVKIDKAGMTLKNITITGDLEAGSGIGAGDLTLESVNVTGKTTFNGGGSNSIHLTGTTQLQGTVEINREGLRLVADSGSVLVTGNIQMNMPATLESAANVFTGTLTINIPTTYTGNSDVVIDAPLSGSINIQQTTATVNIQITESGSASITITAENATIEIAPGVTVTGTISITATGVAITNSGTISELIAQVTVTITGNAPVNTSGVTPIIKAAKPVATPPGGAVSFGTLVTLSSATVGAAVYYTIDGSAPDTTVSDTVYAYTGAIPIENTMTIKAIAAKAGMQNSDVMTESYTISSSGGGGGGTPTNHPPAANQLAEQSLYVHGSPLTLTGSQLATDPDGDALTVTEAAYGTEGIVSLDWSSGNLVISPLSAGTTSVTASVYDTANQGVDVSFDVTVNESVNAFNVTSSGFEADGEIPDKYSMAGGNKSIPLAWSAGPAGTLSYALVMYDPDAYDFIHWMVKNIPADITSLAEAASGSTMPAGSVELPNTMFVPGYFGPSPPTRHKYVTKIYALNVATLDSLVYNQFPQPPNTLTDFNNAIQGKVLASGELVGYYTPNQSSADIAYSAATYDNQTYTEGQAIGNLVIEITNVKNWTAQAVDANTTKLTGNVVLKLDYSTIIPADNGSGTTYWSVVDAADTITITQDYLNTVSDGYHNLVIEINDATNNISNVSRTLSFYVNPAAPNGTPETIELSVISGSPFSVNEPTEPVVISLEEYDENGYAVPADLNGVKVEDDWSFLGGPLTLGSDYTIDDNADTITLTTDYLNRLSLGTNTITVTLTNGKSADVDVMAGNGLGVSLAYQNFAAGHCTGTIGIRLVQYNAGGEEVPADLNGAIVADDVYGDLAFDTDYLINEDTDTITLTIDYLNTLPAGTTTITITLSNGMSKRVEIDVLTTNIAVRAGYEAVVIAVDNTVGVEAVTVASGTTSDGLKGAIEEADDYSKQYYTVTDSTGTVVKTFDDVLVTGDKLVVELDDGTTATYAITVSALVPSESVTLEYLGHAAFVLSTPEGQRVLLDPEHGYGDALDPVDLAIISHEHGDHNQVEAAAPYLENNQIIRGIFDTVTDAVYGDLTVSNIETSHFDNGGDNSSFILSTAGMRLVHMGDSLGTCVLIDPNQPWLGGTNGPPMDDMANALKGPSGIDVLMIPIGDSTYVGALDTDVVIQAIEKLSPKVVIPIHSWSEENISNFLAAVGTAHPEWSIVNPKSSPATFTAGDLSAGTVIWNITSSSSVNDLWPTPSVSVTGSDTPISVDIYTTSIADGTDVTVELVDTAGNSLSPQIISSGGETISSNPATVSLTIPGTVPAGYYRLKAVSGDRSNTSDIFTINSASISYVSQDPFNSAEGTESTTNVAITTTGIADNTPVTVELVTTSGESLSQPVTGASTINNNEATVSLTIPDWVPAGWYKLKVMAGGDFHGSTGYNIYPVW